MSTLHTFHSLSVFSMIGLIFSLSQNLAGIEFDKHCCISFEFFHRYGQAEVIEQEKLHFEVIELIKRQSTNLEMS